jgi:hypothetical protein
MLIFFLNLGGHMRTAVYFSLLLPLIFINFNCKNEGTSTHDKPTQVNLIPGVPDSLSRVESGMDAVAEGDQIHVEWTSTDGSVVFFEVYRGSNKSGPFGKIVTIESPVQYYDDPVAIQIRYYYYVLSVNDEGMRSDPSDTLDYRLIRKAEGLVPSDSCGSRPTFQWRDPNYANDYIIRLREASSNTIVWFSFFQAQVGSEDQSINFNADGKATVDSLVSGGNYQWRIDVIGNEKNSGSESRWIPITIQ